MSRSKYINTFNTTAEYNNYIESAYPEFPNVGYDKQAGEVIIRRTSPNDYQIWGTTTATSNFTIKLNNTNVAVTVDSTLGEFYLTGWTGTLTDLNNCFYAKQNVTSIKKFALDTSHVTNITSMFNYCDHLSSINLYGVDLSSVTTNTTVFNNTSNAITDVYINVEATLMKLTNNLTSQGSAYIPSSATIHYDNGSQVIDYKWQNNAWTPQNN